MFLTWRELGCFISMVLSFDSEVLLCFNAVFLFSVLHHSLYLFKIKTFTKEVLIEGTLTSNVLSTRKRRDLFFALFKVIGFSLKRYGRKTAVPGTKFLF